MSLIRKNKASEKPLIFVVDENKVYNKFICSYLNSNSYKNIQSYTSGAEALKMVKQNPDILILNSHLANMNGVEFLRIVKTINNEIEVLILAEKDSLEVELESMKYGASDYIITDQNAFAKIVDQINNILSKKELLKQKKRTWTTLIFIALIAILFIILFYGIIYSNNLL